MGSCQCFMVVIFRCFYPLRCVHLAGIPHRQAFNLCLQSANLKELGLTKCLLHLRLGLGRELNFLHLIWNRFSEPYEHVISRNECLISQNHGSSLSKQHSIVITLKLHCKFTQICWHRLLLTCEGLISMLQPPTGGECGSQAVKNIGSCRLMCMILGHVGYSEG